MIENKDNKLENIFFKIILKNRNLNWEILKIYDLINNQKISKKDKIKIIEKVLWFWIIDEDKEISDILKIIRDDDIRKSLIYKAIFELIEDIFNINNESHLLILLSNTKEDIETDLIYFLRDILDLIHLKIKQSIESNKSFLEFWSNDYLDDSELVIFLKNIESFFNQLTEEIKKSDEKKTIETKIINELNKKIKLLNIK